MSKSHKKLATFVLDNYDSAAFMTAAKLAKSVGVSEATVVRFAYALGYEGYPEFQEALAEWVKGKLNSVQRIGAKYGKSTQQEIINSVLGADIEKIDDTIEHLDPQAFELAVESILGAKRVYIIGIRSCKPLAEFLQFYLNMVRDDVILIDSTSTSEIFEQMLRINENDVVIGISFPRYSMRTLKALEMANDKNAKVITVTDSIHSPMCLYSSCNLFARSDMVSIVDSLVAPLSLINALVVAICLKRPNDVKTSLESLEYAWDNYQVYLKDEINFVDEEMLNTPLQEQMGKRVL
jgi:DNA-binding MurR/RpiR family transcriptional regulator